jgi:outer membrane immunogenic protein
MGVTMKSLLVGISAAAIAFATTASAADMGIPSKSPLPPAPPPFSWTGCYVGVHGGGGVENDPTFTYQYGAGGLAGGQIGCNYQTGMLVLGIEAEGFWSGLQSQFSENESFGGGFTETETAKNKWDADVAARFGVAFDRALVYGKAGVVWGHFDYSFSEDGVVEDTASATLTGMLIGLGLEYAFTPNWSAKFEADYLGFPTKVIQINEPTDIGEPFVNETVSSQQVIFKFGVNYRFY